MSKVFRTAAALLLAAAMAAPALAQTLTGSITGTIKDEALELRSAEKYGFAQDCNFRLVGTVSSNKIIAKIGRNDVELFK